jgi:phage terminase small subunit
MRWWKITKLTLKQQRFVDEYIISGNATDAAIKAGYAKKAAYQSGAENLKKPQIKEAIKQRLAELEKHKIATADEVLQVFTSILRQELTEEVTELDQSTGTFVTIEKKPSIAEVIKAGSELMKRYPTKLELQKLKLEIEKLQSQVGGSEGQDEKIAGFLEKVKELVVDDSWIK